MTWPGVDISATFTDEANQAGDRHNPEPMDMTPRGPRPEALEDAEKYAQNMVDQLFGSVASDVMPYVLLHFRDKVGEQLRLRARKADEHGELLRNAMRALNPEPPKPSADQPARSITDAEPTPEAEAAEKRQRVRQFVNDLLSGTKGPVHVVLAARPKDDPKAERPAKTGTTRVRTKPRAKRKR